VLSPDVKVDKWARIEESVLFSGCRIGRNAVVRRAILDKNVVVPDGVEVGVDHDHDRARGFHVEGGITVVAKNVVVPSNT